MSKPPKSDQFELTLEEKKQVIEVLDNLKEKIRKAVRIRLGKINYSPRPGIKEIGPSNDGFIQWQQDNHFHMEIIFDLWMPIELPDRPPPIGADW